MIGTFLGWLVGTLLGGAIAVGIVLIVEAAGTEIAPTTAFLIGLPLGAIGGSVGALVGLEWD